MIYDVTGRLMIDKSLNGSQSVVIPVLDLPAGVYRIQVSDEADVLGATDMIKVQ
jgi:hypothetical protein